MQSASASAVRPVRSVAVTRQIAASSRSPVRTRTTDSTGDTQTLPSPIRPVCAVVQMVSHHGVDVGVVDDDLDPDLGHQGDVVLRAAVDLGVALLPAVAADLRHGHAGDADRLQRGPGVLPLVRLDDRGDQLHPALPLGSGVQDAGPGGAGAGGRVQVVRRLGVDHQVDAADLVLLVDPEAHQLVHGQSDDARDDERVDEHRAAAEQLPAELVEPAAVEQAVHARGCGGGGEQADAERADQAADEVDADDVERVVVPEAVLQADRQRADHAGDRAHHDRRRSATGSRTTG